MAFGRNESGRIDLSDHRTGKKQQMLHNISVYLQREENFSRLQSENRTNKDATRYYDQNEKIYFDAVADRSNVGNRM